MGPSVVHIEWLWKTNTTMWSLALPWGNTTQRYFQPTTLGWIAWLFFRWAFPDFWRKAGLNVASHLDSWPCLSKANLAVRFRFTVPGAQNRQATENAPPPPNFLKNNINILTKLAVLLLMFLFVETESWQRASLKSEVSLRQLFILKNNLSFNKIWIGKTEVLEHWELLKLKFCNLKCPIRNKIGLRI